MQKQYIAMTKGGVKAFYAAAKQQRLEAAEHYRDHPEMTLTQVAEKFKISYLTLKKGLDENNIEVDRNRHYGKKQHRSTCPDCRRPIVHFCETPPVGKGGESEGEVYRGKGKPTMKTPGGKYLTRDADYEVYIGQFEGQPERVPYDETKSEEENGNGLFRLLREGRKELGLETK